MPVQLLLPYIRPCGSKCFAGDLLHFRGSGFKAGDLQEPALPSVFAASSGGIRPAPHTILCSKRPKGKNSHYHPRGGHSLTADPPMFDAKTGQMVSRIATFLLHLPRLCRTLMIYLRHSADLLRSIRPRRGGRAAECGGLLIHPDLFVQTNFHFFVSVPTFLVAPGSPH
jgi:hypothetical protein